jgi:hypothetical protein
MKNPPLYIRLIGWIPGRVPPGALGTVEDVNEEEETAFVVFEKHDTALDLPIHALHIVDPTKKAAISH